MTGNGMHNDLRQSQTFQAFKREAAIAAELLATGSTLLGKADAQNHGFYNQAFFNLSIGLERAAKLAFVLDHAITHNGEFPTDKMLRKYCHDLQLLLENMDEIAQQYRESHETDLAMPRTEIHQGIIETLSEFAKKTRYYNLGYLVGADTTNTKEPVAAWYERVGKPILKKHYTQSRRKKDSEKAKTLDRNIGETAFVFLSSESGKNIDTVEALEINSAEVRVIQPLARMYTMQIVRFLAHLIAILRDEAFKMGLTDIPELSEFFTLFFNDDQYFKTRKTWSIYSI